MLERLRDQPAEPLCARGPGLPQGIQERMEQAVMGKSPPASRSSAARKMKTPVAGCNPADRRGRDGPRGKGRCLTPKTIILVCASVLLPGLQASNPHEPMIWELFNIQQPDQPLKSCENQTHVSFTVSLKDLITGHRRDRDTCMGFYVCPASNRGRNYCNLPNHYYCGYWGCETWASEWSTSTKDPDVQVEWFPPGCKRPTIGRDGHVYGHCEAEGYCKEINIKVQNPTQEAWLVGRMWGIRFWEPGPDRGGIFRIAKRSMPHDSPLPMGPNAVLAPPPSTKRTPPPAVPTSLITPNSTGQRHRTAPPTLSDPPWGIVQAAYAALNKTRPNLANECWLCYSVRPPRYEAIGELGSVTWDNGTNPIACPWGSSHTQGLAIQHVTGKGKCVGTVPEQYSRLCNSTIAGSRIGNKRNAGFKWLIPTAGAKWVCSDVGVTPCVSLGVFNRSEFCIQVVIIPRLTYRSDEEVMYQLEGSLSRQKREPTTAVTLAALLMAGGVGAGTGTASLVKNTEIQALQQAAGEDLDRTEPASDKLAASVSPLSELGWQSGRGSDLLSPKEGALCVALQEECCSFVDHTGLVKDSMAELRKRLERRKRDREIGRSWYEGWFRASPRLTALLSALAGLLITVILGLIFGPRVIKYSLQLVKKRFDTTKSPVLTPMAPQRETEKL
uniref:Envelope glycoprotein n=1 Tax=Phasianus colchicus TaxID=9054 RepID=A0A669QCJ5_PHACC